MPLSSIQRFKKIVIHADGALVVLHAQVECAKVISALLKAMSSQHLDRKTRPTPSFHAVFTEPNRFQSKSKKTKIKTRASFDFFY